MARRLGEALTARVVLALPSMVPSAFFQHAVRAACAADLCQVPGASVRGLPLVRMCSAEPRYPPMRMIDLAPKGEFRWLACQRLKW